MSRIVGSKSVGEKPLNPEDEYTDSQPTGAANDLSPEEAEREPAAYGSADMPPDAPEVPVPYGTEIDEEWFSGDTEYWDERAEELAEEDVRPLAWPLAVRALVALVACAALVVLMVIPFGGLAEFANFFMNGAPSAPEDEIAIEDAGSSANFAIQEPFNYRDSAKGPELSGAAAQTSYYLTNAGEVTSVKLQSPWQDCWAFAAVAALESSVLKAQRAGSGQADALSDTPVLSGLPSEPNYSERHLAWFAHERETSVSADTQANEGISLTQMLPGEQLGGGSLVYADTRFTASRGIVSEADEPYSYNGYTQDDTPWYQLGRNKGDSPATGDEQDARNRDWSLDDAHTGDNCGVLVKAAHVLPSPVKTEREEDGSLAYAGYDKRATAAIKKALVEWGAVAFAYHADISKPGVELLRYGDGEYFSYENWAQYDNSEYPTTNHAACIVGWDDNYPAQNFTGSVGGAPKKDGAWLVKNSWGSVELYRALGVDAANARRMARGVDGSGFFWLSYYDHTISMPYVFEVEVGGAEGTTVHQYDYLAVSDTPVPLSVAPVPRVANVFEAKEGEELYAVSARTYAPKTNVEVSVVMLDAGAESPDDGRVVAEFSHKSETGGFEVLDLEEPVALEAGQRFAVIERVSNPGDKKRGYLNLETVTSAGADGLKAGVVANEGETYVQFEGEDRWHSPSETRELLAKDGIEVADLGSAMIKAYTCGISGGQAP